MSNTQFYSIFEFICKLFYSFFDILFSIPLTKNVDFGSIILIVVILAFILLIIFRPIKK